MPDLSADLIDLEAQGLDTDYLRFLFPALPTCEFSSVPMHGCACNGCTLERAAKMGCRS